MSRFSEALIQSKPSTDLIKLAKVGRPHGIRGAFFIRFPGSYPPGSHDPFPYNKLGVQQSSQDIVWYDVEWAKELSSGLAVKLRGINDRNGADHLKGLDLLVSRAAIAIADDEFIWDDLTNRPVVDSELCPMGIVTEVYNAGASDIAVLRDDRGRSVDIPLVAAYVDMASLGEGGDIRLQVSGAIFADLWTPASGRGEP